MRIEADPFQFGAVLILVRHGESSANAAGLMGGQEDSPLTPKGGRQASAVAEFLARREKVDEVVTSDLGRAEQTARAIADRLGVAVFTDSRLREFDIGSLSRWTLQEIRDRSEELGKALYGANAGFTTYGGESAQQFEERIAGCMADLAADHPGRRLVVVTHQAVINWILHGLLGLTRQSLETSVFFAIPNASPTKLKVIQGPLGKKMWRIDYVGVPVAAEV